MFLLFHSYHGEVFVFPYRSQMIVVERSLHHWHMLQYLFVLNFWGSATYGTPGHDEQSSKISSITKEFSPLPSEAPLKVSSSL